MNGRATLESVRASLQVALDCADLSRQQFLSSFQSDIRLSGEVVVPKAEWSELSASIAQSIRRLALVLPRLEASSASYVIAVTNQIIGELSCLHSTSEQRLRSAGQSLTKEISRAAFTTFTAIKAMLACMLRDNLQVNLPSVGVALEACEALAVISDSDRVAIAKSMLTHIAFINDANAELRDMHLSEPDDFISEQLERVHVDDEDNDDFDGGGLTAAEFAVVSPGALDSVSCIVLTVRHLYRFLLLDTITLDVPVMEAFLVIIADLAAHIDSLVCLLSPPQDDPAAIIGCVDALDEQAGSILRRLAACEEFVSRHVKQGKEMVSAEILLANLSRKLDASLESMRAAVR